MEGTTRKEHSINIELLVSICRLLFYSRKNCIQQLKLVIFISDNNRQKASYSTNFFFRITSKNIFSFQIVTKFDWKNNLWTKNVHLTEQGNGLVPFMERELWTRTNYFLEGIFPSTDNEQIKNIVTLHMEIICIEQIVTNHFQKYSNLAHTSTYLFEIDNFIIPKPIKTSNISLERYQISLNDSILQNSIHLFTK